MGVCEGSGGLGVDGWLPGSPIASSICVLSCLVMPVVSTGYWVVWVILLSMLHVGWDMVGVLGSAVVMLEQPVHNHFIVHLA